MDSFFVPGTLRCAKATGTWASIFLVTDEATAEWVRRVVSDFERKAPKTATVKTKERLVQQSCGVIVLRLVESLGHVCVHH